MAESRAADVLVGPRMVTSLMNNRQHVVGLCLAVACGLAGGCRPAAQPSKPPEARSSANRPQRSLNRIRPRPIRKR